MTGSIRDNLAPKRSSQDAAGDVVYVPGVDRGFYVVQVEHSIERGDAATKVWVNVAAFPETELENAEAQADSVFTQNLGDCQVRVIHVGGKRS